MSGIGTSSTSTSSMVSDEIGTGTIGCYSTSAKTFSRELPRPVGWPLMDRAAYYGLTGDFVRALEPHTEADPAGLVIQFLTMSGNMIGNSPYYLVESDKHHAVLFTVLVGASSKGRKGTGAGRVREAAKVADMNWSSTQIISGLSSGEGLIFRLRDAAASCNEEDGVEELCDLGIEDKRLMVIEPEFASALASTERHGNTLSSVVRNAWDGMRLEILTKNNPIKASDTHISLIGHITMDELRARLTKTEMANGFANRFLFCLVSRARMLAHGGGLDDAVLPALGERLAEAVEVAKRIGRVKMSSEAADVWTEAYPELSADRQGLLGAVTARSEAQVIRIALIYALLDCKTGNEKVEIEIPHLSAAMAVWTYCDQSASQIFGDSLGNTIADAILDALRRNPGGLTRSEIHDLLGRHASGEQISVALAMLLKMRKVRSQKEETSGRPSERWFATGSTS
jgi:hypothetical protein